jgi:ClpP class serine protease
METTQLAADSSARRCSVYKFRTIQEAVDDYYTMFVETVAQNRGVSVDQVLSHMADGRDFTGHRAIKAGMADGVLSREDLLAQLAAGQHTGRRAAVITEAGVPKQKPTSQEPQMSETTLTVESVKKDHPAIAAALIDEGRKAASAEAATIAEAAVKTERDRLASIDALATEGCEDLISAAKADGKSTAGDVAQLILARQKSARAEAEKASAEAKAKRVAEIQTDDASGVRAANGGDDGKPAATAASSRALAAKASEIMAEAARNGRRISAADAVAQATGQA